MQRVAAASCQLLLPVGVVVAVAVLQLARQIERTCWLFAVGFVDKQIESFSFALALRLKAATTATAATLLVLHLVLPVGGYNY